MKHTVEAAGFRATRDRQFPAWLVQFLTISWLCYFLPASITCGQDLINGLDTERDSEGDTLVLWTTVPGVVYEFDSSGDLATWNAAIGPIYGLGFTLEVLVHQDPPGGGDPPPPGSGIPYYNFLLDPDGGTTIVRWYEEVEGNEYYQVSVDLDFSDVEVPLQSIIEVANSGSPYRLMILSNAIPWGLPGDALDYSPDQLPAHAQATLALLTGAYDEVHDAMDTSNFVMGPGSAGASVGPGARSYFRVRAYDVDSDGDGIVDRLEISVWGINPFNIDSDGDGITDGVEVLENSDPGDASKSSALAELQLFTPLEG